MTIPEQSLGWKNSPRVTDNTRDPPETPFPSEDQVRRRLNRIIAGGKRTMLDTDSENERCVYDCKLYTPVDKGSFNSDRTDFQRSGGGTVSSIFLSERPNGWVVDEYCIRLPAPETELTWPELASEMEALAVEAHPPSCGVRVWLRPPRSALSGPPGRDVVLDDGTPHFGDWECELYPSLFLDFLSELVREYRDNFAPESPFEWSNRRVESQV